MTDPVKMLKDQHNEVKKLFSEFESADGRSRQRIANEAISKIEIHTMLEEEIFYPAMESEKGTEEMMAEAEEEHHVAKLLIKELKGMDRSANSVDWDAKFTVLSESVKHHIKEEESEMLPKASMLGKEELQQLGEQMENRFEQLEKAMAGAGSKSR